VLIHLGKLDPTDNVENTEHVWRKYQQLVSSDLVMDLEYWLLCKLLPDHTRLHVKIVKADVALFVPNNYILARRIPS
jgi:hypothetical protein